LLKKDWRDIKNGNDIMFWEEQWNKHGKAFNLEQAAYFIKAYDLMLINDLDIKLRNTPLTPRPSPYPISAFKKDLAREMEGVEPILVCLGSKNNRQLAEIRSCINMTNDYVSCGIGVKDLDCDPSIHVLWDN